LMHCENPKMNMEMLAASLSRFVDRPIVDMTGVMAERAAGGTPADAATEPSGGSIFQSVQQLGLKLEARKVPVDKVVIDQLERKPTEN